MSLSVDGFWKSGFWNQNFWKAGFWVEPSTPTSSGGVSRYHVRHFGRVDYDYADLWKLKRKIQKSAQHENVLKKRLEKPLSSQKLALLLIEIEKEDKKMKALVQEYTELINYYRKRSMQIEEEVLVLLM